MTRKSYQVKCILHFETHRLNKYPIERVLWRHEQVTVNWFVLLSQFQMRFKTFETLAMIEQNWKRKPSYAPYMDTTSCHGVH